MSDLLPHQRAGAAWLAQRARAYLADAPRVGKTRTVFAALELRPELRTKVQTRDPVVLVLCPAIVRTHWRREYEITTRPYKLIVMSYDEARNKGRDYMASVIAGGGVRALVLDEAHYLKDPKAQRTKLVLGANGLCHQVPVCWALSGTPAPKHPGELWPVLISFWPAECRVAGWPTYERFAESFLITVRRPLPGLHHRAKFTEKVVGVKDAEGLRAFLADKMLRRTLEDVSDSVPPLFWQKVELDTDADALAALRTLTEEERDGLATAVIEEAGWEAPLAAAGRRKLGVAKAPLATQYIADLLDGQGERKVVVFAHHRDVLDLLERDLERYGLVRVDGSTSHVARVKAIDEFQTKTYCRIFLGQTIACQTGITLDAAQVAVLVEPDWTAVVNQQAGNRVMNVRDPAPRTVQMLCLANTLDEAIVAINYRETRMHAALGLEA